MHILIVNINGLKYLKDLIDDLNAQTHSFSLTVVDQGSAQKGTGKFLYALSKRPFTKVVLNKTNVNLNTVWNNFYRQADDGLLCFLNNDVRVPKNFVKDTINIFLKEPTVGCVVHTTNHPDYQRTTKLSYVVTDEQFAQGWDFTMLKNVYVPIPEELDTFGGDDWLYLNMYDKGYKTAVALSSPIIHYHARSRKYFTGDRKHTTQVYHSKYGSRRLPHYNKKYCRIKPTFFKIENGASHD